MAVEQYLMHKVYLPRSVHLKYYTSQ